MPNHIIIRPKAGQRSKGFLIWDHLAIPCALGRGSIKSKKQEGDGATPIISCRPLYGFYRPDREAKPLSALPFLATRPDMGWCDAPTNANYNRLIKKPFSHSHEDMWRSDSLYDLVIVLDINISCRKRGAGSAIFMHVARDGFKPTEGCIALQKATFRRLIPFLDQHTLFHIGQ